MHKAFEDVACNLCGSREARVLYPSTLPQDLSLATTKRFAPADHVSGNDQIVRCVHCSLVYANPRMKQTFVWEGYRDAADTKYATQTEGRLATFQRAVELIESFAPKCGRLLDVGCAAGFFLKVAQDAGWQTQGIEPNRGLAQWGAKEYGVSITSQDFLAASFKPASFDVVTFWDVLEHVTDPRAYIRRAAEILKPGGFLFINYPDMNSVYSRLFRQKWWFISPVHLYYFTARTLEQYLEEEGFRFLKQRWHWQTLALGYLFTRFADYSRPVSALGKAITKALGIANLPIRYYAGQAVAIAEKI